MASLITSAYVLAIILNALKQADDLVKCRHLPSPAASCRPANMCAARHLPSLRSSSHSSGWQASRTVTILSLTLTRCRCVRTSGAVRPDQQTDVSLIKHPRAPLRQHHSQTSWLVPQEVELCQGTIEGRKRHAVVHAA